MYTHNHKHQTELFVAIELWTQWGYCIGILFWDTIIFFEYMSNHFRPNLDNRVNFP